MKEFTLFASILLVTVLVSVNAEWVIEMENENLFEGDIVLDPSEKASLDMGEYVYGSIKGSRWPNGVVPYSITSSIGSSGARAIQNAIAQYHKHTCIRFKKRTNEWNYISFYRGSGCSSPVGKRLLGANSISLGNGCYQIGTIMHEIGHSLGLYHEQSRPDRDKYVKILWNNIPSAQQHNFKKKSTWVVDSLGTPYDYGSMMHYGRTAFGRGRVTIQPLKPNARIGQRSGFSSIDIKQINLMYKCKNTGGGGEVTASPPQACTDNHARCLEWAGRDPSECKVNPNYMLRVCKKSCKAC